MTHRPETTPAAAPASPMRIALILAPLAGLVILAVWLAVNLGPAPSAAPTQNQPPTTVGQTIDTILDAAQKYLAAGSPGKAELILAEATEQHPSDQRLLAMHAQSLMEMNRLEEAMGEYERACFVGPDRAAYRDIAATIAAQLGDDEKANAHWAVAQKLEPNNPKYPLYRAQVQRRLGQTDTARANLILATSLDPEIHEAWASLAAIALEQNRINVAQQYIERARAIDPDSAFYRVLEARAIRRDGRPEDAANLLYAIPEGRRLRDKGVLNELALCLGLMDEPERAAQMYVDASRILTEDPDVAYEAALWLERSGRPEDAKAYATRAVSLGSEAAQTLLSQLEE